MNVKWTPSQAQRLKEFGDEDYDKNSFRSEDERDQAFSDIMSRLVSSNVKRIREIHGTPEKNQLCELERELANKLRNLGFLEVRSPTIISKHALAKMTITEDHPLYQQVFFISDKKCLRPMLAPNLYNVMRSLRQEIKGPVKIFEIGTCYRKESHSSNHLEEFTMLNLVDLGPDADPTEKLTKYISEMMDVVGLKYELVEEESNVYKKTIDVEVNGEEVASAAVGPHVLDPAHDIHEPWCGVGFGLERLIMLKTGKSNIKKVGRSTVYINGAKID